MKETLRLNFIVQPPLCCNCQKLPIAESLSLTIQDKRTGEYHDVVLCRHCIAEHAPNLLAELDMA